MSRAVEQRDAPPEGERGKQIGVEPLDLRALGLIEDGGAIDLHGLICRLLAARDPQGKTWAQRMAEGWVEDAIGGNARAIEDILDRTAKERPAPAKAAKAPPIDDLAQIEILEILGRERDIDEAGVAGD